MFTTRKAGVTLAGILALGIAAVPSQAQFAVISQPDAAYLSATSLLPITVADFTDVSAVTDGTFTVDLSSPMNARTVPGGGWATWGAPPDSEGATPRVLYSNDATSVTLTFDHPVNIFGLEAEPNRFDLAHFTATFLNGATTVGSIDLDINGSAGARLLAASDLTGQFTSVNILARDTFAIGLLRYGVAGPSPNVPEPGAVALFAGMGVAGSGFLLRRRARQGA